MDADNVADRKAIRRKEKAAQLADMQRREVVGQIMATAPGRAWLWDFLGTTHLFHTTFTTDPYASAFQEGRRSVGLALLADIMVHCPDQYIQAMREANERYISSDTGTRNPAADPLAERSSSALADGRDPRALTDPADSGGDSGGEAESGDANGPESWSPGRDIYAEG